MMTTVTLKRKIKLTSVVQRVDWFTVGWAERRFLELKILLPLKTRRVVSWIREK